MTPRTRSTRWIAKWRSLGRPELVLGLFLVPLLVAHDCTPDTAPNDVRTIENFVECLNHRNLGGDIVGAVQCLPCNCTLTLTLNNGSAQPGCNDQGCPMPRVLLNCPGPPQFQPSFSLCIAGTGINRVEIGETINAAGDMRMGDVHVDPGYVYTVPSDPVSTVNNVGGDTGGCWGCHDGPASPEGTEAISNPLDNFGRNCVTDTDEPCQKPDVEDGNCNSQGNLEKKSFEQICECLDNKNDIDAGDPLFDELVRARALCHALMDYRATRGVCGSEECPQEQGPDCSALATGVSCDPYQLPAAASGTATGYTCQEVTPGGLKQCRSSRRCVDYSIEGGGKFLDENGGVSLLRLLITGRVAVDDCPMCDSTDIDADVRAFNHAADTLVNGVQLSELEATDLGGGDLSVQAEGNALVDGGPANVAIDASKIAGTPSFDIEDTDAVSSLAGGTGEAGRSDFQLNQTPVP